MGRAYTKVIKVMFGDTIKQYNLDNFDFTGHFEAVDPSVAPENFNITHIKPVGLPPTFIIGGVRVLENLPNSNIVKLELNMIDGNAQRKILVNLRYNQSRYDVALANLDPYIASSVAQYTDFQNAVTA